METDKNHSNFDIPLYFFEEVSGKEVCKNMCLIEKYKLNDGRVILVGILSEIVNLKKDKILKEFFDRMR